MINRPDSIAFTEVGTVKHWIDGDFCAPLGGKTLPLENPRYGRPMGDVVDGDAEDAHRAVDAAQAAYPDWQARPMRERAQVLYRMKALMERELESLAWLVSHENGKTFAEAKAGVLKGIECLEYGCALPNILQSHTGISTVSRGVTCELHHLPLGVCAGVTPCNFPIMVPMWMLPQVLVAGNCFVLKPSEQVPASITRLAELWGEAGLPKGVLNVVHGGATVVEALLESPQVQAMAFVGSTPVARMLYAKGAATGKRMLCLGGAKNHLIVVPDADLEMTAHDVVRSYAGMAGQRCMAASAMIGVGDVEELLQRVVQKSQALVLGEELGPIINRNSWERLHRSIENAIAEGAKVLLDGRGQTVQGAEQGFWLRPTILEVTSQMQAYREELFGPVLSVLRVADLDQALDLENQHMYANGGSIYTTSGATARYAAQRIHAGMTGINIGIPVPREPFSFGGWAASKFGHGDITGWDGFRFWTKPRKITTKWSLQPDATWMS